MGGVTLLIDLSIYSGYALMGDIIARWNLKPWAVQTLNKSPGVALLSTAAGMVSVDAK